MPSPTRIAVTIDTEEEWDWASGYPTGPTRVTNIQRLPALQEILDRHGAKATYFTNHAVLSDASAREVMLKLSYNPNVEIGLHIHPWNTPPLSSVEHVSPRESFLQKRYPFL